MSTCAIVFTFYWLVTKTRHVFEPTYIFGVSACTPPFQKAFLRSFYLWHGFFDFGDVEKCPTQDLNANNSECRRHHAHCGCLCYEAIPWRGKGLLINHPYSFAMSWQVERTNGLNCCSNCSTMVFSASSAPWAFIHCVELKRIARKRVTNKLKNALRQTCLQNSERTPLPVQKNWGINFTMVLTVHNNPINRNNALPVDPFAIIQLCILYIIEVYDLNPSEKPNQLYNSMSSCSCLFWIGHKRCGKLIVLGTWGTNQL